MSSSFVEVYYLFKLQVLAETASHQAIGDVTIIQLIHVILAILVRGRHFGDEQNVYLVERTEIIMPSSSLTPTTYRLCNTVAVEASQLPRLTVISKTPLFALVDISYSVLTIDAEIRRTRHTTSNATISAIGVTLEVRLSLGWDLIIALLLLLLIIHLLIIQLAHTVIRIRLTRKRGAIL
jgi:hypothetical protein